MYFVVFLISVLVCSRTRLRGNHPIGTSFFQASGLCYHSKVFRLHQALCIPIWMAKFFSWTLEPIFSSPEPATEARIGMGATVDIQRQQRMERLDRQLTLSQFAQVRRQRQQVSSDRQTGKAQVLGTLHLCGLPCGREDASLLRMAAWRT